MVGIFRTIYNEAYSQTPIGRITHSIGQLRRHAQTVEQGTEIVIAFDTNIGNLDNYAGTLFEVMRKLHEADGFSGIRIIADEGMLLNARVRDYLSTVGDAKRVKVIVLGKAANVDGHQFDNMPDAPLGTQIVTVHDAAVMDPSGKELLHHVDVPDMIRRALNGETVIELPPAGAFPREELRRRYEEEAYYWRMA